MRNKYVFVIVMLICISLLCAGLTKLYLINSDESEQEDGLLVVTSFYPMYIAALNVADGVPGIRIENLSEPQTGCLHDFTLTPEDMKLLSKADIFIINGGGIENFMAEVASSYPDLTVISSCDGITLLGDEEEENAHAWMSVEFYREQIESISNQMALADPSNRDTYIRNAAVYDSKLAELEDQQNALLESGLSGENIVIFHEAFEYVAHDYNMNVCGVMDLDEERQISAGEVADVINIINENNVKIILAEELYGAEMGNTVSKETGVKMVYLDPLNRGEYNKDSYLLGMEKNIELIEEAKKE